MRGIPAVHAFPTLYIPGVYIRPGIYVNLARARLFQVYHHDLVFYENFQKTSVMPRCLVLWLVDGAAINLLNLKFGIVFNP